MAVKQTAGRDGLGDFAPEFARLNDDVLFGEVWAREDKLSLKMRSILTVSALVSKGMIDSPFQFHAMAAKKNGVTKTEMAEILTHLAFYAGWPNAWAAFRVVKDVYAEDNPANNPGGMFGMGEPNTAFAKYFVGNSYLKPLTDLKETVFIANVTFEPGCRKSGEKRRRSVASLYRRRGLVSGGGKVGKEPDAGRRRYDSRRCKALARREKG